MTIHIENVIISVTTITKMLLVTRRAKMPLYGVFAFGDIKSCGTAENAVQRIYIKFGNTKWLKLYAVQGQRETAYLYKAIGHFVKNVSCGYKMVTVIRLRLLSRFGGGTIMTMRGAASPRRKWSRLSETDSPYLENRTDPARNNTLLEKCRISAHQSKREPVVVTVDDIGMGRTPTNQPTKEKEKRP